MNFDILKHEASSVRFCKTHNCYYHSSDPAHQICPGFSLTNNEVLYYLNRFREMQETFTKLRQYLNF